MKKKDLTFAMWDAWEGDGQNEKGLPSSTY
jgi:hypothetical protein